jgi:simple sugar transport system ATP-binding protein
MDRDPASAPAKTSTESSERVTAAERTASATAPAEPVRARDDVLRAEHIAKSFGPVRALRDVNLHLRKGEILGLLGDNGAGKSTLMKIVCGFQRADAGDMWLNGKPYRPRNVQEARRRGVDAVYQDLAVIDQLPVYHNLFLRREKVRRPVPFLAKTRMRREARKALDEIGIDIPQIDAPVAHLSGGQRQAIAVARAVYDHAEILLLDEPLAAMGAKEGAMILELIERLRSETETSIIMILHNYPHVFATCDRVNLISEGVIALDKPTAETSVEELTEIVVEEYRRARRGRGTNMKSGVARLGPPTSAGPEGDGEKAELQQMRSEESASSQSSRGALVKRPGRRRHVCLVRLDRVARRPAASCVPSR